MTENEEWRAQMAQEDREWEAWKRRRDAEDAEAQRKVERVGFWLNVVGITCGIAWLGFLALAIYIRK